MVLYNLGRVLGHIDGAAGKRPEEAVRVLRKCTEINPHNAKCWLYVCVSLVQLQEMQQARMTHMQTHTRHKQKRKQRTFLLGVLTCHALCCVFSSRRPRSSSVLGRCCHYHYMMMNTMMR